MSDKELLELAAKAAGIDPDFVGENIVTFFDFEKSEYWNPLTDDGDALRLAVKLEMSIENQDGVALVSGLRTYPDAVWVEYHNNSDPYAASRRAIVRAAAEIGRTK
jgi:hypothetical protein